MESLQCLGGSLWGFRFKKHSEARGGFGDPLSLLPVLTFISTPPSWLPQKRQILVTIIEICLPLLFAAILIALRHRVHSVSHPNATIYPSLSVDDLPGFFYRRHPGNPWELAYVPSNSSAVQSIARAVERALPISIRGEQSRVRIRRGAVRRCSGGAMLLVTECRGGGSTLRAELPAGLRCPKQSCAQQPGLTGSIGVKQNEV